MNRYKTEFFSECPVNKVRVKYDLLIETEKTISVEELLGLFADYYASGFHELMADDLYKRYGGRQTMKAFHHGVEIETVRP